MKFDAFLTAAATAFSLTIAASAASACTPHSISRLNTSRYASATAQCGSGADTAYVQTTLRLSGGLSYLYTAGNGAISACWFIYSVDGQQWYTQPLPITNYVAQLGPGPAGLGYLLGMQCAQFDGTLFGVYAGPCNANACGPAVVF